MPSKPPNPEPEQQSQFLIYRTESGAVKIDVRFERDTVWLSQALMAELFETTKQNIAQHLANVFDDGELVPDAVVKRFFTTAADLSTIPCSISVGSPFDHLIRNAARSVSGSPIFELARDPSGQSILPSELGSQKQAAARPVLVFDRFVAGGSYV
jgi:hypothetical protein